MPHRKERVYIFTESFGFCPVGPGQLGSSFTDGHHLSASQARLFKKAPDAVARGEDDRFVTVKIGQLSGDLDPHDR